MQKPSNHEKRQTIMNGKINVKKLHSLIQKQTSVNSEEHKINYSRFLESRQDSIGLRKSMRIKSPLHVNKNNHVLRKGVSRSVEPEQNDSSKQRTKLLEWELEQKKLDGVKRENSSPVKVLEGDMIFLKIKSEVKDLKKASQRGFNGILCANGVVGQGLFSLEKNQTEELQPGKFLFKVILKTNLSSKQLKKKTTENIPVIFGQRLFLKHVFSGKYLRIELENLANEKGRVRAILTEEPADLKILPSTWTKLQGQNMFYGEGVLVCPGDSEKLFLSIESECDLQGRFPVNGSDVFCEWIPHLFTSENYSKALSSNSLLNGSFGNIKMFIYL